MGINLPGLIVQAINVLLVLFILRLFLYKPVLRMLDRRSTRIREGMEAAERMKEESARSEEEVKGRLEESRREGQSLINQATEVADRIREEAREEARKEGEVLITRARSEIQRERDDAVEMVRREFAGLAITAAEKVINTSLDKKKHRKLIEDVLEESLSSKRNGE